MKKIEDRNLDLLFKYTIKNDIIFKYLFSDEDILKDFLETVLDKKIYKIEVINNFALNKIMYEQKQGVLDIKAEINDKDLINIEMQDRYQKHYTKRILIYAGNLMSNQLKISDDYSKFKNVVSINILNFTFPNINQVHTKWMLEEINSLGKETLEGLEIHLIELTKFRNSNPDLNKELNQWLALIDTMNREWVGEAMKKNEKIKMAIDKAKDFVGDNEAQILMELRRKWQLDYNSWMAEAREIGLEQGREEGLEQGKSKEKNKESKKGRWKKK